MHDILTTPAFEQTLRQLSQESGAPVDKLRAEAADDLREMAAKEGKLAVAGWDRFCAWLARAYNLDFDPAAVQELRRLNQDSALIFLPNHRSYLDPLVLRSALEHGGFPPNKTLGGANLKMWPLSEIGQRNGIVFIRREFRNDHVYRAVLKAYLGALIQRRNNLEWYIEGGRTRTGKLRPPRYGVLSYVVDAFADHPEHDVKIIPTAIVYDQQHEVGAISEEEMGGTKVPESLPWLYNFAKSQSRRLGRAYLRFGEPLSMGDALSLTIDDDGNPRPRLAVPKLAFETAVRINAVTPVTPNALITFALLDNGDRAITADEGRAVLTPLLEYIGRRKLPVIGPFDLARHGMMRDSLDRLVREGVVDRYDGGSEPVFSVALEHQHEAAYYRNTIIHFFITRAITELALLQAAEEGAADVQAATWTFARRLKEILKFEFFFPTTRQFAEDVAAESTMVHPGWEQEQLTPELALDLLRHLDFHLAHRVVGPFLEAYSVLAAELTLTDPAIPVDESALVARCLGVARQHWLQKTLHTAESISKDYFVNAVKLADNQQLLEPGSVDLQARRDGFAAELRELVRRLDDLRRMAQASGQPVLTERALTLGGVHG